MDLIEKVQQKDIDKLVFQIKNNGVDILKNWLIKPIIKEDVEKKNHEVLLRFAFMDTLVSRKEKITFLKSFETFQAEYVNELQSFLNEAAKNMPFHGRMAFEYGIASSKTTLKWCKKVIKEINKNNKT